MLAAMSKVTSMTWLRLRTGIFSSTALTLSLLVPFTMAINAPFRPLAALLVMIV
ncbi:hypothetical protein D3C85_1124530 [compost metagenome]